MVEGLLSDASEEEMEEMKQQWSHSLINELFDKKQIAKIEADINNHQEYKDKFNKLKLSIQKIENAFKGEYTPVKLRNFILELYSVLKDYEAGDGFGDFINSYNYK